MALKNLTYSVLLWWLYFIFGSKHQMVLEIFMYLCVKITFSLLCMYSARVCVCISKRGKKSMFFKLIFLYIWLKILSPHQNKPYHTIPTIKFWPFMFNFIFKLVFSLNFVSNPTIRNMFFYPWQWHSYIPSQIRTSIFME